MNAAQSLQRPIAAAHGMSNDINMCMIRSMGAADRPRVLLQVALSALMLCCCTSSTVAHSVETSIREPASRESRAPQVIMDGAGPPLQYKQLASAARQFQA